MTTTFIGRYIVSDISAIINIIVLLRQFYANDNIRVQ